MRKGSAVILTIVVVVAAVGLMFLVSNMQSPTGFVIGTGNIPLSISGQILNCGPVDEKLIFTREDGDQFTVNTVKNNYKGRVNTFSDVPTQFSVSSKSGQFIEIIELPIPSGKKMQVDLSCAVPTPEPSDTPVPTEEPTPTTPPPPPPPPPPSPTTTVEPTGTPT